MPMIDELFRAMAEQKSSDLHLTTGMPPMIRRSGDMMAIANAQAIPKELMYQILAEIAPEKNKKEFIERWDTDFCYELKGVGRFRSNLFMDNTGPGAVFRLIPTTILTIQQLNLPPVVLELCKFPKGTILVTGPTGSGKSTTLAAMINHINETRSEHIITLEDPIEFVHTPKKCLINQREIHSHTQSFANALRAALRQDPDIVLVGEMRDLETTRIAIETAETGHLVFGTLHTSTAGSTVDRLINQFPAGEQDQIRLMLAASLRGVIAQTLAKKKGGGRVGVYEILTCTSGVSAMIREGKTYQIPSAMQTGRKYGMQLLNDMLEKLVREGAVEPAEAMGKAVDKDDMLTRLTAAGHPPGGESGAPKEAPGSQGGNPW